MKEFFLVNFDPIVRWGGCLLTIAFFFVMSAASHDYVWRKHNEAFRRAAAEPAQPPSAAEIEYRKAFSLPARRPRLTLIKGGKS